MPSLFTWLDHSEHERRRALDVISLFRLQETRDELGLASIRDAFADRFFPGTTTIQTRVRYFLLVPWLCMELERKMVPSERAPQRLRSAEEDLIGRLLASGDATGVIGKEAGRAVKRMPSSIYWAGLRRWGILSFDGSLAQYHKSLDRFYLEVKAHRARAGEDREGSPGPSNWHVHVPSPPGGFPEGATMRLREEEAEYLRERILTACRGSLLAHLADVASPWDPVNYVWECPALGRLPQQLEVALRHARTFSEVMHGAALLYNLMLEEALDARGHQYGHRASMDEWAASGCPSRTALVEWDLMDFWRVVSAHGARVPAPTRSFVEAWVRRVRQLSDPRDLADDAVSRRLIREREAALKGGRARLASRRHLDLWNGASGTAQLDFRWGISQDLLLEVLRPLTRPGRGRRPRA